MNAMKILVDTLGGDNAPAAVLEGAVAAFAKEADLFLIFAGKEEDIKPAMEKAGISPERYEILPAKEAVLNTDHPATFLKEKPCSSLAVCFDALRKRDDIDGMISAGPTGALLTGAVLKIGRLPGVGRPALMATLPTRKETFVRLIDAGANMDCKPEYLLQFALMADTYLRMNGLEKPRVALLSVGQEEGKGNELTKTVYPLLKESGLNFVGNIEGDHVLKGEADIVVADGFSGNVFLKATEEGALYVSDLFKGAIFHNFITKIGALFMVKHLKAVKKPFDAARKSSAPLLGTKKLVLKCHGKADAETFKATILEAVKLTKQHFIESMKNALSIEKPEAQE